MSSAPRGRNASAFALAAGSALIFPLLTMAMGSPLFTKHWVCFTLWLWLAGVGTGVSCAIVSRRLRPVGLGIALGTVMGCLLFVATYMALFSLADWD